MTMKKHDLGLLLLRLTAGGLLAGHGAQKLFGWFGGHGIEGVGGWLESLGIEPGRRWAVIAGASELGAGLLTAAGLLHPVGPVSILAPMTVATRRAHRGKPIWGSEGGAELPVVYMAVGTALALTGPGRYALDRKLGTSLPLPAVVLFGASVAIGTLLALVSRPAVTAQGAVGEKREVGHPRPEGSVVVP
jgi:putative oxidoreductase